MDKIREAIIARAETLGLTAYAIAKQCVGDKTPDQPMRLLSPVFTEGDLSGADGESVYRGLRPEATTDIGKGSAFGRRC